MNYFFIPGVFSSYKSTLYDSIKKFSKFEAKSTKFVQVRKDRFSIDLLWWLDLVLWWLSLPTTIIMCTHNLDEDCKLVVTCSTV